MTTLVSDKSGRLDPRILKRLKKRLGKQKTENAIRSKLSRIRSKHNVTLNAAAQILAKSEGFNVMRYLKKDDINSLKTVTIEKVKTNYKIRESRIIKLANYSTDDILLNSHIKEINRSYTYKCYTSTFIICRKVLENLIIKILRKKYHKSTKEHKGKYYDFNRKRSLDFSILIKNLRKSANDFDMEKKLVQRICEKADEFKETADEMTHSLCHIATKKEIDEKNFQHILDLIQQLEKNHFS